MEQLKSKEREKAPLVPIKTYKWEELRRSRLKGGYPWTYLYKDPYDDNIDPEQFKMSEIPKSHSVSTLDKSMHSVDILEVPTDGHSATSQEHITEPSSYIVITEVPSDVESHSKSETKDSLNIHEETEMNLLRADSESSDNISQYLDKDEPDKQPIESVTTMEVDTNRQERSKSEEPKRKRKHSIESSYSRKSLSKLAIMKKLKGAADKIKVPKLALSKTKQTKQEEKPKPEPTNTSKTMKVDEKPVYIHIPLKPPPGETDEFSYLEFEEKKPPPTPPIQVEVETKSATNSNRSSRIQEDDEEVKEIESPTKIEELPPNYDQRRFSGDPNEIVAIEIVRAQSIDLASADIEKDLDNLRYISNDPNAPQDDVIIILSETDENGKAKEKSLSRQSSKRSSTRRGRAKSAEPERKRKLSLESSYSRKSLSKLAFLQKLRDAKEKLKISNLLSRSNSKKQSKTAGSKNDLSKTVEVEKDVKKLETPKKDEPKYIHIPLKPPPGQTDEFSYLEFEEKPQQIEQPSTIADNQQEEIPESPVVEQGSGVQFIVLTPPSDDEILDSATDVPDTPTNESQFELDNYKKIAQGAIERVSPESKKKLQIVKEEQQDAETAKIEEIPTEEEKIPETVKIEEIPTKEEKIPETIKIDEKIKDESDEKIEVDEEDGLKLSEPVVTKQEQELKSSLKSDGILKKKVSFKRRSRDESKDGIYEDVEPRKDEGNLTDEQKNKLQTLGTSQSMSVDEEKTYLDEKIIKSTSLEEDYNRWSKISDHEYEPVNPPPDNVSPPPPPPVIEISPEKPVSQTQEPPPVVEQEPALTIQEIQTQIEEKFFKTPTPSPPPSVLPPPKDTETDNKTETETKEPNKFQQALKNQADKFKSKLVSIKKPTITMPSRPKFDKTKFEKFTKFETPKFHLPKIPDTAKIHLPTFNTTRKTITTTKTKTKPTSKRSLKQRQFSTESNMGDSKRNYFDFSTYPRIFKKKPKKQQDSIDSSSSKDDRPEFATVPRTKWNRGNESWTTGSSTQNDRWGGRDTIRIPLHGEESFESNDRDGLEETVASHIRYDMDIDNDDAYERENQQIHTVSPFSDNYNSRWNHGTFHPETTIEPNQITDLDSPEDESIPQPNFERDKPIRDVHSSESSLGIHRRGVLEEIDSDEFFLRQKGISQDNIEVGMYLSSEIREAFKSPTNALSDLQNDIRTSNQSLPETTTTKKKSIKKPKRKKTPHVSQEHLSYDQDNSDSEQFTEDIVPARPKRRSKRSKKQRDQENVVPYQETIALDVENKKNEEESIMYENQQMEGKEQPEIQVIDPYAELQTKYEQEEEDEEEEEVPEFKPEAPPRRHRSLKSLNYSEHDSIMDDIDLNKELSTQNVNLERIEHEYIIPTPDRPPMRPSRLHSRSSSNSRDINREFINQIEEAPIRPARTRSQSRARSQIDDDLTSRGGESLCSEPVPCVEEPCCQDLRDYMGYAIIDKQQRREPPLPPPRNSSRTRQTPDRRFFTVARTTDTREPPVRPLRNYSTLGPNRPPRRKLSANMTDEEKQSVENIDIIQYIEIEDEPNRDLNSGEIIQKMRDRPLPAPPRPPRKIKHDHDLAELEAQIVEVEVSTQTDNEDHNDTFTMQPETEEESVHVERKLITPTHYSYEETITHGSLVVEPLNGAQILPDSQLIKPRSQERIVPVTRTYDDEDEETSEIPEDFKRLKNPPPLQERPVSVLTDHEVEIVKTQKLQVSDLDVDRLSVNELMANKIIVSEIESSNLHTNEINSRTGAIKIGEIELPPSVVQQLVEKLQSLSQEQATNVEDKEAKNEEIAQKKTPIDENVEPSLIKSPIESQEHSESFFEITQITQTTSPPDVEQIQEQAENIEEPPEILAISDFSDNQNFNVEETIDENIEILNEEEERLLEELKQEADLSDEEPLEMLQENTEQQEIPSEQDIVTELQYERSPHLSEEIQQEIDEELPETPPQRPPRSSEKPKPEESDSSRTLPRMQEPELDDEPQPPPRPPQPPSDYVPSQPPASFYALRAQQYVDNIDDDIPIVPRRRRHYKATASRASRSSSDDDNNNNNNNNQRRPSSRRRYKSPEPTIPQLTGQLMNACCTAVNSNLKRLIVYITHNYLGNIEHNDQDLNVLIVILLILIAGLILLGYGDGKTVHHHHWEYFNPPRDM